MKKRLPTKKKSTLKTSAPPPKVKIVGDLSSPESNQVKENWVRCDKCGATWTTVARSGGHTCDPFALAAHGKHVCIDCLWHHESTVEELTEISIGGYCKHLTPEWWASRGWERGWGDAAVMAWPDLEILCRHDGDFHRYLILNGKLRRPVEISFAKDGSELEASY
jgi:hypothetical protein